MWEPFQWPRGATPPDRITRSPPTLYTMPDDKLLQPLQASDQPNLFLLRWHNHSSNIVSSLSDQLCTTQSLDGAPFCDVTLVCDDDVRLYAHRVILSASSPDFYEIFKSTADQISSNNSHSYIILKDVESSDMKLLLQYIYKGEVTVAQSQLNRLLIVAKSLKVRGLTGDLAENALPNCKNGSNIPNAETSLHPQELTVSKKYDRENILKTVADTTKPSLSSGNKVSSSPLDSKFSSSLLIPESLKEKLGSRSSTPVSRSHSPLPGQKYLKEEIAIKSESDIVKTEPAHQNPAHSSRDRSRSPPACPTPPAYSKPRFDLSRDAYQYSLLQPKSTFNHPSRMINLERDKLLPEYAINTMGLDPLSLSSTKKTLAPSPYSDDEIFMYQRDISPPLPLHPTTASSLSLRIPHSTTSPPSPSSPTKRKRFPSSLLNSGLPPHLLSHQHYGAGLQMGRFNLNPYSMFPSGYSQFDNLMAKNNYPEMTQTLGTLSVKKDLGMTEDDKQASVKRRKVMENGPLLNDLDVRDYLKISTPNTALRLSPSAGLHLNSSKLGDGVPPTSTSNLPESNASHSSLHSAYSSSNSKTTNSPAHYNSSVNNHDNNTDSVYQHHPRADLYSNGPSGETSVPGAGNSPGNSKGSSGSHSNTNGGSSGSAYNGQFVNYVGGPKPEWKRYKQYSKSDLMQAIEEVKNGMTALQASRKYKVPSRTLYDKIKKLGITTTPRRNVSTVGNSNKLRNHHVKSEYNIHGVRLDRQDGGVGDHADSFVLGGSSGGGLVSEAAVGDGSATSGFAGSLLKADSLTRYDSSRPHSVDSSATSDSFHPLDLQVSKANTNEITASASVSAADFYSKLPLLTPMDHLNRIRMEADNRYLHERNSDNRLHHPCAPKSILDLLPRQTDTPANDNDQSELSKRYECLRQINAHFGMFQHQAVEELKGNPDSQEMSHSNNLDQHHSNDGNHLKGNETDDDSEIVVDTSDEIEKKNSPSIEKENEITEVKTAESEFRSRSPFVHGGRNDNDTAYISHSTSAATEPSSSDSPPSSSFTTADSGHDSNNDTSTTSDNEGRHHLSGSSKIKHPNSSPEIICAVTPRPITASPKVSETSISGSDISPNIPDKGQISLDSDPEVGAARNAKTTTGSYKVVSEIGICSQVRPLDLREASVAMSIPQESV